jgi:hypothetical protein
LDNLRIFQIDIQWTPHRCTQTFEELVQGEIAWKKKARTQPLK